MGDMLMFGKEMDRISNKYNYNKKIRGDKKC